jgi:hypothetical protein
MTRLIGVPNRLENLLWCGAVPFVNGEKVIFLLTRKKYLLLTNSESFQYDRSKALNRTIF